MIFLTFLAMAVHEIKKFKKSLEPYNGPEDDPFVRWVDVDPGQAPPSMPFLLDDLIPPPPNPNNYHNDGQSHVPSAACCPPIWMYRTEYYASEADKYEKNFGKKFPADKAYVVT
ncbi:uncharacterized protein [Haliotis cracherodii]|uniref:uncharacterized protein n=1 Tax=Haliotis cracherodii TaxID=6455 RepID=UPI0039E80239